MTQSIPITLLPDSLNELDETVRVTLSAPSNVLLGDVTTTTLTLHADSDPPPQVAFQRTSSADTESVRTVNLTVNLSARSGQTVTVPYSVTGGTATGGGVDYSLPSGLLTFAPHSISDSCLLVGCHHFLDLRVGFIDLDQFGKLSLFGGLQLLGKLIVINRHVSKSKSTNGFYNFRVS